jgi:cytochrome c oxidase assembly factor CtaG
MMTTLDLLTQLWNWRSPAWWIALAGAGAYGAAAVRNPLSMRNMLFPGLSLVTFLIAMVSPLAGLASRYMFSAHMAQHLLLLLIVPLFVVLALPKSRTEEPLPPSIQRVFPIGWLAGVGAMWFWHIPALCTASMRSPLIFDIEQASLVAAGTAFWWPIFSPNIQHRLQMPQAVMYLFSGCLGCTLLGIYITFSPISVCPLYNSPTGSAAILHLVRDQWGITHEMDQQLGGLLMWVPACIVYLCAILARFSSWHHASDQGHADSAALVTE